MGGSTNTPSNRCVAHDYSTEAAQASGTGEQHYSVRESYGQVGMQTARLRRC